jgi:hypothetical protein
MKARIKKNVHGNWCAYLGGRKVETFSGSSEEQGKKAWQWLERERVKSLLRTGVVVATNERKPA